MSEQRGERRLERAWRDKGLLVLDDTMTEDLWEGLKRTARWMGCPMADLFKLARAISFAEVDPLADEDDEGPVVEAHYEAKEVLGPPDPYAAVDLWQARESFKRGLKYHERRLGQQPSFQDTVSAFVAMTGWLNFWAVRHPLREVREMLREQAARSEAEVAELREQVERYIREHYGLSIAEARKQQ